MTVGALLLAAGRSRRFGRDKRLCQLPDGRRLLDASISNILGAGLPLIVCLREDDSGLMADLASRHISYTISPNAKSGMGHTLADGIAAAPASWTAVIIGLGDMPMIQPETYKLVEATLAPGKIVVPHFQGHKGHPVGFDQRYFPQLKSLTGDQGARSILHAHPRSITVLEVADPGIVVDVDTVDQAGSIQQNARL